ncbi:MAG: glutamine--fructose-6-phosphate transaminase (isomerizing), partial [Clostridia bacterium]|nr:glutamine--fructose-6-phosphate transaminase (isomerizing) [Clostridia bacterium]
HTRWATHGAPSEKNAHPHSYGKYVIVHNGIIENHAALKEECLSRGETFLSETDSEVIAHLIAYYDEGDFLHAVKNAVCRLEGSYAIAVLSSDFPDQIVCARGGSPLVVGRSEDGNLLASDLVAISSEVKEAFLLEDGEFAVLEKGRISFYNGELKLLEKSPLKYDTVLSDVDKKGYMHFMKKEMDEIPSVLAKTSLECADKAELEQFCKVLCQTEYIHIVACGTAYHSGLCAKYAFESLCRVPVEVCIASEYRYKNPIIKPNTLVIAISQSGETADTLAAAKLAKERGAYLAAVTNVAYSSLTRIADCVLETRAGAEVAVAATKSFNAQLAILYSLALLRAGRQEDFSKIARLATATLQASEEVRGWTPYFLNAKSVYFIGRGVDYCAALEGSLKLKEISYLPSEGYAAGELKHGTLALVDEKTPVVAILTQSELAEKTMNAVHETRSRGARVFLITSLPEVAKSVEATASVLI